IVATDPEQGGVVSPGGVGFDINCGVRLLRTRLRHEGVRDQLRRLVAAMFQKVPTGVGSRGEVRLTEGDKAPLLTQGARWAVERGFGSAADLPHVESGGALPGAVPEEVSERAFERGRRQLGTLGSGNHFAEIQVVREIFDPRIADVYGLFPGQVTVMIHTGSRGFGHQVCTDFLEIMEKAMGRYGIRLPDRQLACAPLDSPEGRSYLGAMRCAANFAWANRQCIRGRIEEAFLEVLGISPRDLGMVTLYDVAHNIVKVESHRVNGKRRDVAVHRKGATRAFPPGHEEIPADYREAGQPVLIPGDMGRHSFVLAGTDGAMEECFGSTCHGAGRRLSRHAAKKAARGRALNREMEDRGVIVMAAGRATVAEEMPEAYKDVSDVVEVVHEAGIARKVARLTPVGCIKG
ncbi:MAG: RtcB family protein, partial [Candidatus Tectomicrobia bacterium]|nr:RtcB family protein [Candidatus Tectomicrobia bacterium]